MISMKIEFVPDKVIIYLYRDRLSINNIDILNKEIKNIFINLIKKYHLDFFGYSKVSIYNNPKYGNIMEIEKIYDHDFSSNVIDLKIIVYKNAPMYLKFDDYYFNIMQRRITNHRNKEYLINISDIDNITKYIEYGKISYKDYS